MKERNISIDAVKGLAIVLVVIGHVFVHNHMEDPYIYDFIKAVQMPLFIIISGYLCGQGRKVTDVKSYGNVMKKRAIAYMVPFFVWLTAMHLNDLGTAYKTIFVQLDYGLWFFGVLFILTFMVYTAQFAAAMFRGKNQLLSEMIFWTVYGIFGVILVFQILIGNRILSPNLTIIYVPFYMMGYVCGNYGKRFFCWNREEHGKIDLKNSRVIQMGVLVCAAAFLYLVFTRNLNSMETRMDVLVQMIASVLGCVAIIYGTFQWRDGKIKNIFAKIGTYTLEIYVVHYHFANMLNFHDKQYDFYTLEGALFVLASVAAMCAATICCIWLMKKFRILDFLFFGKKV